jgi:predicted aminopeptidase
VLLASGCTNVGYYWQSVSGQLEVWRRERPIEEVFADPSAARALKDKLARVLEIRAFASRELGLPDNRSYRRYADLGRPFVVWNVFAAPEFSLKPVEWCFAFAGCVTYRGYFAKEDAERFAAGRAAEGYDVFVGGVPAYSTLGWFADPMLSTVINYSDPRLARLLFHELSHQVVYVRGDTVFNESFAVAVEKEGVRRWLASRGSPRDKASHEVAVARQDDFLRLARTYQAKLTSLYRTRMAPEAMRARKKELFEEMELDYRKLKDRWGGFAGYDRWFVQKPNNAQLASVGIYSQLVPAFEALLEREGGDLPRFYAAVKELATLSTEERDARLRALSPGGNK